MSASQLPKSKLCLNIIEEHFGSIVGCVAKALIGNKPASLDEVLARANGQLDGNSKAVISHGSSATLPRRQVMDALLVLIQHNCVETTVKGSGEPSVSSERRYATNGGVESSLSGRSGHQFTKRTRYLYRLMVSACLRRIRAHKYISHVRREFGDVGASIVEAFFLYGRMSKDALVKDIMPLLEAEAVSLGKDVPILDMRKKIIEIDGCDPDTIKIHFDRMIKRGILETVPPINGDSDKLRSSGGIITSVESERDGECGVNNEKKPPHNSIRDDATTLKRNKSSLSEEEEMWRLSTIQLDAELRDEMCLAAVIPRIPEDKALVESVLRALLNLWKSRFDFQSDLEQVKEKFNSHEERISRRNLGPPHIWGGSRSPPVSLNEVVSMTRRLEGHRCTKESLKKRQGLVHRILKSLSSDRCRSVVEYMQGNSTGSPSYVLNMGNILEFLCKRSLHSILEVRYDLPSARIVTILLEKRYLEQKEIAEMAMVPAKDAREKLYRMYRDRVIDQQEVPKRNDRNPSTTIFLWVATEIQLRRFIMNQLYLSLYHIRVKRHSLKESKRTLIHQQHRLQEGPEADEFYLLVRSLDRLDQRICQLDEHLLLFSGD